MSKNLFLRKLHSPEVIRKNPLLGAAGGIEEEEEDASEMFDVRPMTVGFVERGANRRTFFAVKSEEGDSMSAIAPAVPDELDATLARIANAASATDEDWDEGAGEQPAAEDPNADPKKKKPPFSLAAVMKDVAESLGIIAQRRDRDPLGAAQRALGNVGGHEELKEIATLLMEYINANGGTTDPNADPNKPKPAVPKPPVPAPQPGDSPTGTFSIAEQSDTPKPEGEGNMADPITIEQLSQALSAALDPIRQDIAGLKTEQTALQQSLNENKEKREEQEMSLLAKSMNVTPASLVAMKKAMPIEDFAKLTDTFQRQNRMLQKSGMWGEIGTGDGGGEHTMDNEVMLEKAARKLVEESGGKMSFSDAVIQAGIETGLDLNDAPVIGRGE